MPEESYEQYDKAYTSMQNVTGNREQDEEGESSASEGETETVGKPTGKTPDTQNVWDIRETVMEKRTMEEIPRVHGNKSCNTCHQRDVKWQGGQVAILGEYSSKR